MSATIVGSGWATPPAMAQRALWDDFFVRHHAGSADAERIFRRSGVVTRHGVVDPRVEDVSAWSTGERMRRFAAAAPPLGARALSAALADADLSAGDIDHFTVVSCTGYATPGVDVLLARDLGMPASTQRLHVGHMGCFAALPALAATADAATARGRVGALLCLELTSLHLQPPSDDLEQVVAHALFSDAAAAVIVTPGTRQPAGNGHRLEVLDVAARTDAARADLMTWDVTDQGFRMGLSPRVPDVLAEHVADAVGQLLGAHGLRVGDVAAWAVHPGGPRIVDVVADRLALDEGAVAASRAVLAEHGNCSSATVLLILDRILEAGDLDHGAPLVALAFGPGLTLYAALLRACGPGR